MPDIRTLVPSGTRSEEDGQMIIVLALLRAFWLRRFMDVALTGFHTAVAFVQCELITLGIGHAGFGFDETKQSRQVTDLLRSLTAKEIITIAWSGTEEEIAFNPDTGKRLLAALRDQNLEADENKLLMPICDRAVSFYVGNRTRETACDQ